MTAAGSSAPDSRSAPSTLNIADLTPAERDLYFIAYTYGYAEGHQAGALWADETAALLHRAAHAVVRTMARMPEADPRLAKARDAERARIMGRSS